MKVNLLKLIDRGQATVAILTTSTKRFRASISTRKLLGSSELTTWAHDEISTLVVRGFGAELIMRAWKSGLPPRCPTAAESQYLKRTE